MPISQVQKLVFDVPEGQSGPPSEFRIFAFGKTNTSKGAYVLDGDSAAAVMSAAAEYGNRLTLDYEHMALSEPPQPAPAAGSFVLELRADGLWATDVKWTARASAMLSAREYLYFSPAFTVDEEGRPSRLLNVALTNLPATHAMTPLVAANQKESPMKGVLTALSLKDGATEAEAIAAVARLSEDRAAVCALTGKDSYSDAIGVLNGWKISAGQVDELKAQIAKLSADKAAAQMAAMLDAAVGDGRLLPSQRAEMEALGNKLGADALASCLGVLKKAPPAATPVSETPATPAAAAHGFDDGAVAVLRAVGQDPVEVAKFRQKLIAARQGRAHQE
jgi:phage I-like protein